MAPKDRTDFYLAALNSNCHRSFDSASLSSKPSAAHDYATGRSRHRCPRTWWYAIRPSVLRSGLKPPQTGLVSDGGSLEWVPSTPATLGAAGLVLGQRCRPL